MLHSEGQQWRVFCAIELPEEVRAKAADHIARLRSAVPNANARWERIEKMHITLKFFGEIEAARVSQLSSVMARVAARIQPFGLKLEGTGAFPSHRSPPRILWLGITDASHQLKRLQQILEDECDQDGFVREARDFHPHLTIARLRAREGASKLVRLHQEKQFQTGDFTVTEVALMRSELGPGGSLYTALAHYTLTKVDE